MHHKSTQSTTDGKTKQAQARALLADIQEAPDTAIPRRDTIVAWLNSFLARSDRKGYVLGETEADDLIALDQFLRSCAVPVAVVAAAVETAA